MGFEGLFASKPAPTLECISNVGAGLLAKAFFQALQGSGPVGPHKQPHHLLHMGFGGFLAQLAAAAIQQAKIRRALEQAEEVLSRRKGLVDVQRAALADLAEQALHALQHAHRARFEEDL